MYEGGLPLARRRVGGSGKMGYYGAGRHRETDAAHLISLNQLLSWADEANEILELYGMPWTEKWGLTHISRQGCCGKSPEQEAWYANKATSVKRAQVLASLFFLPPISEPAANKYTKIDPCVKSVALIS